MQSSLTYIIVCKYLYDQFIIKATDWIILYICHGSLNSWMEMFIALCNHYFGELIKHRGLKLTNASSNHTCLNNFMIILYRTCKMQFQIWLDICYLYMYIDELLTHITSVHISIALYHLDWILHNRTRLDNWMNIIYAARIFIFDFAHLINIVDHHKCHRARKWPHWKMFKC